MRIVILSYESHQANLMTQALLEKFSPQVVGIMPSDVIVAKKTTWQSISFLFKKTGLGFVARKGGEIILGRLAARISSKSQIPSLQALSQKYNIPLCPTKNLNSAASRAQLQAWQPDLIVSVYFNQLIGKRVIKLATKGVINIHPALLPKNRGLFPYFWALCHGDTETGVTVHWVSPEFDTGDIILQESLPISPEDTVISLARHCAELGARLLPEAIRLIGNNQAPRIKQDESQASYFSWPDPKAFRQFRQNGRHYGSLREMWQDLKQ